MEITLKIIHLSILKPNISAYKQLTENFDDKRTTMDTPITRTLVQKIVQQGHLGATHTIMILCTPRDATLLMSYILDTPDKLLMYLICNRTIFRVEANTKPIPIICSDTRGGGAYRGPTKIHPLKPISASRRQTY